MKAPRITSSPSDPGARGEPDQQNDSTTHPVPVVSCQPDRILSGAGASDLHPDDQTRDDREQDERCRAGAAGSRPAPSREKKIDSRITAPKSAIVPPRRSS